jgi:hypothetical protein
MPWHSKLLAPSVPNRPMPRSSASCYGSRPFAVSTDIPRGYHQFRSVSRVWLPFLGDSCSCYADRTHSPSVSEKRPPRSPTAWRLQRARKLDHVPGSVKCPGMPEKGPQRLRSAAEPTILAGEQGTARPQRPTAPPSASPCDAAPTKGCAGPRDISRRSGGRCRCRHA